MKILEVKAEGFEIDEPLALDLSDVRLALITGDNWQGKTRILNALRAAVSGTVPGLARNEAKLLSSPNAGRGWKVTTRAVAPSGEEVAWVRTATSCYRIDPEGRKGADLKEADLRQLLCIPDVETFDAAFDAGKVLDMKPEGRMALALRHAGVKIDVETLAAAGIDDPTVRAHALGGAWKKAAQAACDKKREFNRLAAAAAIPPKPCPMVMIGGKEVPADEALKKLDVIRKSLTALEEKERLLIAEEAKAAGRKAGSVEALKAEMEKKEAERNAIDLPREEAKLVEAKKAIEECKAEAKRLTEEKAKAEEAFRAAGAAASTAKARLSQLKSGPAPGHDCPTCGLNHAPAAAKKPTLEEIAAAEAEEAAIAAKVKPAADAVEAVRARMATLQQTMGELKAAAEAASGKVYRFASLDQEAMNLLARINEAENGRGAPETDYAALLADVREKIARGREVLRVLVDRSEELDAVQRSEALAAGEKAKGDHYAKMEASCSPDGLPKQLVAPVLDKIRTEVRAWSAWLEFDPEITDDFEILVPGRPLALLSGAEILGLKLALAAAYSSLSGLKWMALDEFGVVSASNRAKVLKALASASKHFDQVLVLCPLGASMPRQFPARTGIRWFLCESGRVAPVGPEMEFTDPMAYVPERGSAS